MNSTEKPLGKLVYSVGEVSFLLGIGRSSAYEAIRSGLLPCIRIGRRILVVRTALEQFLKSGINENDQNEN